MRYIDADKHLQKLGERRDTAIIWELNCNDEATKDIAREAILIFNECILELINAPTADVRENVKGEWIERKPVHLGKVIKGLGSVFICSVCGEEVDCKPYNFCPNCGSDMRPSSALSENAEIDSNIKRGEA